MTKTERLAAKKERRQIVTVSLRKVGQRRRKRMKIVGLIPARGDSKGIKLKNIQPIGGYPLIAHSILTLKAAGIEVFVSTDSAKIGAIAKLYGANIVERPEQYAMDNSPTEQAIGHFLENVPCTTVIMVQCTSPLLRPNDIQAGLDKFLAGAYDSLFSVVAHNDLLIWDDHLKPWNYRPERRGRRQSRHRKTYVESGGFYIFSRQIFEAHRCRIAGRHGVQEVPFWQSFQVDTKHDLKMIDKIIRKGNDV